MKKILILTTVLFLVSCKSIKKVNCEVYSKMDSNENKVESDIFRDNIESMKKYSTTTTIKID